MYSKAHKGKPTAFARCIVRGEEIHIKPEEIVRQLYAHRLMEQYAYPKERIQFEYPVNFGREVKKADIFDKDRPNTPYIIIELKKPNLKEEQLRSYYNATGSPMSVWTNALIFAGMVEAIGLANAGVDVFEEVFKLIFTKLYNEYLSQKDKGIINYLVQQVVKTAVSETPPLQVKIMLNSDYMVKISYTLP